MTMIILRLGWDMNGTRQMDIIIDHVLEGQRSLNAVVVVLVVVLVVVVVIVVVQIKLLIIISESSYRIRSINTRVRIRHCRHCFRPAFLFSPYALLLISPLTSDFQLPVFK